MKSKNDVEVLINGRRYTICGFESAEYLQRVATYINSKYAEFKSQDYYYSLDMDLRNILLAINIADDYFKSEKEKESLVRDGERKDKLVLDMKHEVLDMQSRSDDVVTRKEELRGQLDHAEKKIVELNVKNEDNSSKLVSLEEKLTEVSAENSSHATKLEVSEEHAKKLESENSRLKKKNDTLNDKVKTLNEKVKKLNETIRTCEGTAKKLEHEKEELNRAHADEVARLQEKSEQEKEELNRAHADEIAQLQEKLEQSGSGRQEELEKENQELQAKIEAAERRIADLESRNRKGKR